jgi:hypothetical protein
VLVSRRRTAVLTSPLDPDLANLPTLRDRIKALAAHVEATASPAQDFRTIVHSLLLRTDEQLERLLGSFEEACLPLLAYATRNLLELLIWTAYVLKSNENTSRFAQDWLLDAIGLLEGLEGWHLAHGGVPSELTSTTKTLEDLRTQRTGWGLDNARYLRVAEVARDLGLQEEYDNLFKVYSKIVHPTSWSILGMEKKLDPEGIKRLLLFRGVFYAGKTFCLINDHINKYGLVPITCP